MTRTEIEKRIEHVEAMVARTETAVFAKEQALAMWQVALAVTHDTPASKQEDRIQ